MNISIFQNVKQHVLKHIAFVGKSMLRDFFFLLQRKVQAMFYLILVLLNKKIVLPTLLLEKFNYISSL